MSQQTSFSNMTTSLLYSKSALTVTTSRSTFRDAMEQEVGIGVVQKMQLCRNDLMMSRKHGGLFVSHVDSLEDKAGPTWCYHSAPG